MAAGTMVPEVFGHGADFPRAQPLVLDLGCGNGAFLAGLAEREPGWNILGIEKKAYRARQARRRSANLSNARVTHGEVVEILSELPAGSVSRVYLLFSDPWPKRRHAVRRLVQEDFLRLLPSRLGPGGIFFFASDSADYALGVCQQLAQAGWRVGDWVVSEDWPRTEFEQRFVSTGLNIWRFQATR